MPKYCRLKTKHVKVRSKLAHKKIDITAAQNERRSLIFKQMRLRIYIESFLNSLVQGTRRNTRSRSMMLYARKYNLPLSNIV